MRYATTGALGHKMEKIRSLYERPGTHGEKVAAGTALVKIQKRLLGVKKYVRIRDAAFPRLSRLV